MGKITIKLEDFSSEVIRQFKVRKGASSCFDRTRETLKIALEEAIKTNLYGYVNIIEETTQEIYLLSWAGFEVEKSTAKEAASFLLEREDEWSVSKKIKTTKKVIKSYLVDFR